MNGTRLRRRSTVPIGRARYHSGARIDQSSVGLSSRRSDSLFLSPALCLCLFSCLCSLPLSRLLACFFSAFLSRYHRCHLLPLLRLLPFLLRRVCVSSSPKTLFDPRRCLCSTLTGSAESTSSANYASAGSSVGLLGANWAIC